MNTTRTLSVPALREALYMLALTKEIPDANALDDVVRQFPQYNDELTEFAISIAADALRGDSDLVAAEAQIDTGTVSASVNRAMSRFQNRLFAMTSGQRPASAVVDKSAATAPTNPIADLSRDEFRAFAQRIKANTVFAMKLRDRRVVPTTMTPGFQQHVAVGLRAPIDVVVAHFAAAQTGGPRASRFYKSDGKPTESGQQTFEEAVRSSGLTDNQQCYLLGL
jgi:hypothetical protein